MHLLDNNSHLANEVIELGVGYEICRGIKSMIISNNQYCSKSLKDLTIMDFPRLKSIEIGKYCFTSVRKLEICHCPGMESLAIGSRSFTLATKNNKIAGVDGLVQIHDCSQLKTIHLDGFVFFDYHQFEMRGIAISLV